MNQGHGTFNPGKAFGLSVPSLGWLPGESFFSLCSRQHAVLGLSDAERTSHLLFGEPRGGVHDLPGHLDAWARRQPISSWKESIEKIVFDRTVLGFYRPFLTLERAQSAALELRAASMGSLKFKLGLLTSRFRAEHPLKACRTCISEDQASHSVAYWHQVHQWPGVWLCPHHGDVLQVDTQRAAAGMRYTWCLPSPNHLQHVVDETLLLSRTSPWAVLDRMANMVQSITSLGSTSFLFQETLVRAYRQGMLRQGLQSPGGRMDHEAIGRWFSQALAPLAAVPELHSLAKGPEEAAQQFTRVFHRPSNACHPLRHIAVMSALFEDWSDFWKAYEGSMKAPEPGSSSLVRDEPKVPLMHTSRAQRTQYLELLADGATPSRAAKLLGIEVATAQAWATRAGITINRRPKKLQHQSRHRLIQWLQGGMDKPTAAERSGVSIETVTRILRTEVGLSAQWHAARQKQAQTLARSSWLKALKEHGRAGRKAVRQHAPAAYAWLYRNDKEWLQGYLPSTKQQALPRQSSVDWKQRDRTLAAQVHMLRCQGTSTVAKLWKICAQVPGLKAKMNQIQRLPDTRRAVESILGRPWTRKAEL